MIYIYGIMGFYILYIILFEWAFAFLRTSKWFFPRSGHTWPVTFSDRQAFLGVITRGRVAPPGENSWDLRQRKLKFMTKHEQSWTIHHLSRWSIPGHKLILVLTSGNDKNQALHQSNSYHVFFVKHGWSRPHWKHGRRSQGTTLGFGLDHGRKD